jgi:hypothetical protein
VRDSIFLWYPLSSGLQHQYHTASLMVALKRKQDKYHPNSIFKIMLKYFNMSLKDGFSGV